MCIYHGFPINLSFCPSVLKSLKLACICPRVGLDDGCALKRMNHDISLCVENLFTKKLIFFQCIASPTSCFVYTMEMSLIYISHTVTEIYLPTYKIHNWYILSSSLLYAFYHCTSCHHFFSQPTNTLNDQWSVRDRSVTKYSGLQKFIISIYVKF